MGALGKEEAFLGTLECLAGEEGGLLRTLLSQARCGRNGRQQAPFPFIGHNGRITLSDAQGRKAEKGKVVTLVTCDLFSIFD